MSEDAGVEYLRSLVEQGDYVWSNQDREPLDDQNPTYESIASGQAVVTRRPVVRIPVEIHPGDVREFVLRWVIDLPGPDLRLCKDEAQAIDHSIRMFGDETRAVPVLMEFRDD